MIDLAAGCVRVTTRETTRAVTGNNHSAQRASDVVTPTPKVKNMTGLVDRDGAGKHLHARVSK